MMIARNFCSDVFWDLNQTWNNQVPDFSNCFQDAILVSLPSLIFSFIFLINIWHLRKTSTLNPLPWRWLNMTKMVLSVSLLLISIIWCGVIIHEHIAKAEASYSSLLSSCTKVVVFILNIILMLKHRTSSITTSYVLSVFWLVFSLCGILLHRSAILNYFTLELQPVCGVICILNMIYYPFIYVQLFLTIFVDEKSFDTLQDGKIMKDISLFSFITYQYFNRYIYKSAKKLLTVSDLAFLNSSFLAACVYSVFVKLWPIDKFPEVLKSKSLAWRLIKSSWRWEMLGLICSLIFAALTLVPPLILDRLIHFASHDSFAWRGAFYVFLLFMVDMIGKASFGISIYSFFITGTRLKSALMNSVYRKNLMLSTSARREYTSGEITNLLSVDIQRMIYLCWHASMLITSPIRIIIIITILWQYIGIASLAGAGVMAVIFPISFFISRVSQKFTAEQMTIKDTRLKYMNEVLSGIKILKLYAWELAFSAKVSETRRKELKLILYSQLCSVVTMFLFMCAPIMVSIANFATYLFMDHHNVLDPTKAFVTLTLMDQLKYAMLDLPDAISELIQCNISLGRLKKFFVAENMDPSVIGNKPAPGETLTIRKASFTWNLDSEDDLTNIELHVPQGKLVAVIGPVGSGKSSLLSAILGEMYKTSGTVDLKGSLAYVPQQAWILNQTVKENILMMKYMDEKKYKQIVELCCLRPDFDILPAGDLTEIGEKGVNLSGGQKQRVSLARAVYQNKDVYLLDDTLSAVDVHVRKALFDDIIGNEGLLKKKTRILVTHDLSVLHRVDLIVSMKDGKIDEIGTYQDLLGQNGSFTEFIQENTSQKHLEENTEENKRLMSRFVSVDSTSSKISESSGDHITRPVESNDRAYRLIQEEKMEIGKVHRLIYFNYVKNMSLPLAFLAFLGYVLFVAFETYGNIWLSEWTSDPIVNGTQNLTSTVYRLEVYGAMGIGQAICIVIGSSLLMFGSITAAKRYHNKMLYSLVRSPMSFFDSTPMGRIANRFSSDLDVLDTVIVDKLDGWIDCLLYSLASFYIIGSNTPMFLVSLIPIGIIAYILQKLHLNCIRQIRRLESTTKSPLYSQLLESIQGVSSICAYKVQKNFIHSFEEKLDNNMVCFLGTVNCNRWQNFMLDMLGSVIVLIASLLAVQNRHNLSAAEIGLMITYTLNVTDSIKWFVRRSTELEDKSISIERVDEYCHLKSEADWKLPQDKENNEWPSAGNILFDNYSTKYREDLDLVLKDVNLSVNGSEKVGIIGRTGAGKSSITMALFRIIEPVSGTIFIDDVDIKKIGLHSLRSKLTIIPQDPVLFTGSLRSNLDPNEDYDDDALWKSLEQSHLKNFVTTLDEGLEFSIEEGGDNLSVGQKQLVCLARALLKRSKILVLDEATASVDMETDNLIQNTIRTAFADNTVITIAHRLNTVMDYDKIVVMENGSIIETGNPTNLLKDKESRFYEMAKDAGLI